MDPVAIISVKGVMDDVEAAVDLLKARRGRDVGVTPGVIRPFDAGVIRPLVAGVARPVVVEDGTLELDTV